MVDPSNNSFIPKRGPAKLQRGNAAKQIYVFSILSYILMFSSLLSAGGIFLYSKYFVEKQRDEKIVALDTAIRVFSEADMQAVVDFDRRLQQASEKFDTSIALGELFKAFEEATIDTVKIDSLSLERKSDPDGKEDVLALEATLHTDSVSSAILQRGAYKSMELTSSISIAALEVEGDGENKDKPDQNQIQVIKAEFEVPISEVPFSGNIFKLPEGVTTLSDIKTVLESVNKTENLDSSENSIPDNPDNQENI